MRRNIWLLTLILAGTAHANSVYHSGNSGLYLGYAYGNYDQAISPDNNYGLRRFKGDEWSSKYYGGFQVNDHFAIEGFHNDFGSLRFNRQTSVKSKSSGAAVIASIPLTRDISAYGKLGIHEWREKINYRNQLINREGRDIMYGAGASIDIGQFNVRLEHERYEMDNDEIGVTNVGVAYRF